MMIESLSTTQILETKSSIETMHSMKSNHIKLRELMNEISFWLLNDNQAATDCKLEVTEIFEQMTDYCI